MTDTALQLLEAWKSDDGWGGGLSYDELVLTFCDEIVSCKDFGDYQGDYVYHLRRGSDQGVLIVGYGSCSGCDALQDAEGYASNAKEFERDHLGDVVALRDQLAAEVKWASEGLLEPRLRKSSSDSWWSHDRELNEHTLELARKIDALG